MGRRPLGLQRLRGPAARDENHPGAALRSVADEALGGVADLSLGCARNQLRSACWPEQRYAVRSADNAQRTRGTAPTDSLYQRPWPLTGALRSARVASGRFCGIGEGRKGKTLPVTIQGR